MPSHCSNMLHELISNTEPPLTSSGPNWPSKWLKWLPILPFLFSLHGSWLELLLTIARHDLPQHHCMDFIDYNLPVSTDYRLVTTSWVWLHLLHSLHPADKGFSSGDSFLLFMLEPNSSKEAHVTPFLGSFSRWQSCLIGLLFGKSLLFGKTLQTSKSCLATIYIWQEVKPG